MLFFASPRPSREPVGKTMPLNFQPSLSISSILHPLFVSHKFTFPSSDHWYFVQSLCYSERKPFGWASLLKKTKTKNQKKQRERGRPMRL